MRVWHQAAAMISWAKQIPRGNQQHLRRRPIALATVHTRNGTVNGTQMNNIKEAAKQRGGISRHQSHEDYYVEY